MISRHQARRLTTTTAVVAMIAVTWAPEVGAQESADGPPKPILGDTIECDPATDELVLAGEWSNPSEFEMQFVDLSVALGLGDPAVDAVETIDLTHLYPLELAPGETVEIGPERLPGDRFWNLAFTVEVVVEGFEETLSVASTDELNGPCGEPFVEPPSGSPASPAEPVEEPPQFTG